MTEMTHLNASGEAHMVDIHHKSDTLRIARASCVVQTQPDVIKKIREHALQKGDVLAVARVTGIMAAKKTSELIPLCHPLPLHSVEIEFELQDSSITVCATAGTVGKTGVEMEALTAVVVTALALYDMCKSMDRAMVITDVLLDEKSGGKSGTYKRGG